MPERSISAKNPSKGPVTGGKLTIFGVEGLRASARRRSVRNTSLDYIVPKHIAQKIIEETKKEKEEAKV